MINDYLLVRKMYQSSVPEESRDEEVVGFIGAQYSANAINKNLSTLKYLKNQLDNPIIDFFGNECLVGINPSRADNSKKAILIKLKLLLKSTIITLLPICQTLKKHWRQRNSSLGRIVFL